MNRPFAMVTLGKVRVWPVCVPIPGMVAEKERLLVWVMTILKVPDGTTRLLETLVIVLEYTMVPDEGSIRLTVGMAPMLGFRPVAKTSMVTDFL
jgi:hypothetical protein